MIKYLFEPIIINKLLYGVYTIPFPHAWSYPRSNCSADKRQPSAVPFGLGTTPLTATALLGSGTGGAPHPPPLGTVTRRPLPRSVARGHERVFCPAPTRENRALLLGCGTGTCPAAPPSAPGNGLRHRLPTPQPGRPGHRPCPGAPQTQPALPPASRPAAAGPSRTSRPAGASPASTAARGAARSYRDAAGRDATRAPLPPPPGPSGAAPGRRGARRGRPGPRSPCLGTPGRYWERRGTTLPAWEAASPSPAAGEDPPGGGRYSRGSGAPRCPGNTQAEALGSARRRGRPEAEVTSGSRRGGAGREGGAV